MVVQFWQIEDPSVIFTVTKEVIVMCMSLTLVFRVINHWASTYELLFHSIAISDSDKRDPSVIIFDPPTANNVEKLVCCLIPIRVAWYSSPFLRWPPRRYRYMMCLLEVFFGGWLRCLGNLSFNHVLRVLLWSNLVPIGIDLTCLVMIQMIWILVSCYGSNINIIITVSLSL